MYCYKSLRRLRQKASACRRSNNVISGTYGGEHLTFVPAVILLFLVFGLAELVSQSESRSAKASGAGLFDRGLARLNPRGSKKEMKRCLGRMREVLPC